MDAILRLLRIMVAFGSWKLGIGSWSWELDHLRPPQVVQMHDALDLLAVVDDDD